ncbi:MAG: PAS domain S-box protein [Phycisphaerales bacterium]
MTALLWSQAGIAVAASPGVMDGGAPPSSPLTAAAVAFLAGAALSGACVWAVYRRRGRRDASRESVTLSGVSGRDLFESLPDMVFLQDAEGRYLDYHAGDPQLLIVPPSDFIGRTMQECLPPDMVEQVYPPFEQTVRTGEPSTLVYRLPDERRPRHFEARVTRVAEDRLLTLVRDVTDARQAEASHRFMLEQQSVLLRLELARSTNVRETLQSIVEAAAETLSVERVGLWLLDESRDTLVCEDLFVRCQRGHTSGQRLPVCDFPTYFKSINESYVIAADDVQSDERTREFADGYLKENDIRSMLDVPVRRRAEVIGVLCMEHVGSTRTWRVEEQDFAKSLTDMISLVLESEQRRLLEGARMDQSRVLEMISMGRPLEETLDAVVELVEDPQRGLRASVQMVTEDQRLQVLSAPTLPKEMREVVDGLEIGPKVGTCGQSITGNTLIVTEDISRDDAWEGFHDLARQFELGACWSQPIRTEEGEVVGTLAVYATTPMSPTTLQLALIEQAARIAGIAVQKHRAETIAQESRERLELALAGTGLGVWDWDRRKGRVYVDERWAEMLGYDPDEVNRDIEDRDNLIHPEDIAESHRALNAHLNGRTPYYESEYRMRSRSGEWRWILDRGKVMDRDENGRAVRITGTHLDISDRRESQRQLHISQQLVLQLDHSPLGVISWDREFRVTRWSGQAERFFGWTADEVIGQHFSDWRFVHDEDAERVHEAVSRLESGEIERMTSRNRNYRKDGAVAHCEWFTSCIRDEDGRALSYLSLIADVTERARAEERQALMVQELNHRVKNNLAAVLSLADQTSQNVETIDEFRDVFVGRINALVRTHSLLAETRWRGMQLGELARMTLAAYGDASHPRIEITGAECMLPARAASPICMALHELATNAAKYGALSSPMGRVKLAWTLDGPTEEPTMLHLAWSESNGPKVSEPERRGLGTALIKDAIRFELNGDVEIDFRPDGLRCNMTIDFEHARRRPLITHADD